MEMTGAQILIKGLLREQAEHIFGYAGATICPAVDVLRDTPSHINDFENLMCSFSILEVARTGVIALQKGSGKM